jgi:SulP family sulfate permease
MGEWHEFVRLKRFSNHYRLLMLSTFFLTVVFDLTVAVEVGLFMACALFVRRMSGLFRAVRQPDVAPTPGADLFAQVAATARPVATWRLHGALFFGAAAKIDPIIQAVETGPPGMDVELDACELVALDTTGLDALEQILKAVAARGGRLSVTHLHEQPRSLIERSGFADRLAAQGGASVDV